MIQFAYVCLCLCLCTVLCHTNKGRDKQTVAGLRLPSAIATREQAQQVWITNCNALNEQQMADVITVLQKLGKQTCFF